MKTRIIHRLLICLAALAIGVSSVISAARMTEATLQPQLAAYVLVSGSALDGFCGEKPAAHVHSCPFCRLLADTPDIQPVPRLLRLVAVDGWVMLADLTPTRRIGDPRIPVRGPPILV